MLSYRIITMWKTKTKVKEKTLLMKEDLFNRTKIGKQRNRKGFSRQKCWNQSLPCLSLLLSQVNCDTPRNCWRVFMPVCINVDTNKKAVSANTVWKPQQIILVSWSWDNVLYYDYSYLRNTINWSTLRKTNFEAFHYLASLFCDDF